MKLTPSEKRFIAVVKDYSNIADAGNLMMETAWGKNKVLAIARSLAKKGLIDYTSRIQQVGFEGAIFKLVNKK